MCGKYDIGKWVSRGRTLVASADEAWAIRGLEGTGGKARCGRVLSDKGRGRGGERGQSRRGRRSDKIARLMRAGQSVQGKDEANQVEAGSGSGGVVAFAVLVSARPHAVLTLHHYFHPCSSSYKNALEYAPFLQSSQYFGWDLGNIQLAQLAPTVEPA
jgi:hypothetical protein